MARLKRPDQYIIDTHEYWMPAGFGLVAGGLYSIPSATASAVGMAFGKKPDVKKTIGSTSGMAIGIAYDIWARQTGRSATLGAARTAVVQLAKPAATRFVLAAGLPTATAAIVAYTAHHNVTAPPPPEYQHPRSPWYFSVAQALTGGFGIGTAGMDFV